LFYQPFDRLPTFDRRPTPDYRLPFPRGVSRRFNDDRAVRGQRLAPSARCCRSSRRCIPNDRFCPVPVRESKAPAVRRPVKHTQCSLQPPGQQLQCAIQREGAAVQCCAPLVPSVPPAFSLGFVRPPSSLRCAVHSDMACAVAADSQRALCTATGRSVSRRGPGPGPRGEARIEAERRGDCANAATMPDRHAPVRPARARRRRGGDSWSRAGRTGTHLPTRVVWKWATINNTCWFGSIVGFVLVALLDVVPPAGLY
jgi:hypothetical protein